jgi:opacity protein-like surface antigen
VFPALVKLSRLLFCFTAALAGLYPADAAAQSALEIHTGLAGGAVLGQGRSDPGYSLLGTADVGRAGSRLGLRGELFFSRASHDEHGRFGVLCDACSASFPIVDARTSEEAYGVLVGGTYGLTRASRLRPYLLAGVGVYRTRTDFRGRLDTCPPGAICTMSIVAESPVHESEQSTGAGMHMGLGTAFRVGPLDLTAEARYHLLDRAVGSRRIIPLTIGVRF